MRITFLYSGYSYHDVKESNIEELMGTDRGHIQQRLMTTITGQTVLIRMFFMMKTGVCGWFMDPGPAVFF